MHKLLALDLDGTVLNSSHTISPALIDAIKRIAKKTHVIIVTGRHHVAARPYHEALDLDTPIICCNGTYTFDYSKNQVISENSINKEFAKQFITLSDEYDLNMVMYVRDAMLYSNVRPIAYMEALTKWAQSFPIGSQPNIRRVSNFFDELNSTDYVWKFVVEGGDIERFASTDFIKQHFNGERSWADRVDFAAAGNTKGNALTQYVHQLGVSLDKCVAAGDNHNDISMLKAVGLGIAMQNADETVKNSASQVTQASNDDETSLAYLLESLFL
jgi:Cof subfamily protein (haloacid dehalogenase superfamily)